MVEGVELMNDNIKIGVSTASFYPIYIEKAFEMLGENGVLNAEIFFNTLSEIKPDFIKEIKKIAENKGVSIPSIHPYTSFAEPFVFFSQYERRFLEGLDYYKNYFEAMNILGSKILVFHGDNVHRFTSNEFYFERYNKLVELGKIYGVIVAQENVARCKSGDVEFLLEMKKALGENAKFVFDTKQAARKGYNPHLFYEKIKDSVVHIHISDYGEKGECLFIGEGILDFEKFSLLLKENNYIGSIMLELYSSYYDNIGNYHQKIYENYNYMKSILDKN